ncbi:MAG: hypothetical protein HOE92_07785 [Euryarchaeota archaeon]|jgi:hypothetical protein|nr:hypothetical protein [Euryarchaeota archaeon]MBT3972101.1 hypothetical protein [Euryarchaeota archaeon]MBT4407611.1 hypothetical protein [Euryarchaeota archaeon]MBT6644869.1 hypothetical protein [Euryarchaeota archaeon]
MAKKKRGFGKFLGAITGSPYDQLLKQIEKQSEGAKNDSELGKKLKKLSRIVQQKYEEEAIDEEEHDLLMEEIEEVDPKGRSFPKLSDDTDEFYDGDIPDAPELKLGKKVDLDDLMRSKKDSFSSSFGRDEFDEFRNRMTEDFYAASDEAIQAGDHNREIITETRVFGSAEDDTESVKRKIVSEGEFDDPNAVEESHEDESDDDDSYRVDEDGTEWWKDDDGYWWFRGPEQEEWQPYDE